MFHWYMLIKYLLKTKKFQVFDEMNELYYEQLVEIENIEEIEEEMPIIEVGEQPPIEVSPVVETPKVATHLLIIQNIMSDIYLFLN